MVEGDASCAMPVDDDAVSQGVGNHSEVWPLQRRSKIAVRCRPAFALILGELERADADLIGPVEILIDGQAPCCCGLDP